MRTKKRYLVFNVTGMFDERTLSKSLRDAHWTHFGDFGTTFAPLIVRHYSPETGLLIVETLRDQYMMVMTSISVTKKLVNKPCSFQSLYVAGTLKSAEKAALKHVQGQVRRGTPENATLSCT